MLCHIVRVISRFLIASDVVVFLFNILPARACSMELQMMTMYHMAASPMQQKTSRCLQIFLSFLLSFFDYAKGTTLSTFSFSNRCTNTNTTVYTSFSWFHCRLCPPQCPPQFPAQLRHLKLLELSLKVVVGLNHRPLQLHHLQRLLIPKPLRHHHIRHSH